MKLKKAVLICIIIITICFPIFTFAEGFIEIGGGEISEEAQFIFGHLRSFSFLKLMSNGRLSSEYSYGTLFWTKDTEIHVIQSANTEKNGERKIKCSTTPGQDIEIKITNCAVDQDYNMCDVVIKIENIKAFNGKVENSLASITVQEWVEKCPGLIEFNFDIKYATADFSITYYKANTTNPANVPYTVPSIMDIDAYHGDYSGDYTNEFCEGNEFVAIPIKDEKDNSAIYYDTSAEGFLSGGRQDEYVYVMTNKLVEGYEKDGTHGTPGDDFYKVTSATITEKLENNKFTMKYGGCGCGIGYVFASPYAFELPNPVKTVSADTVYENETYKYTISQYVPNNYYASLLDFVDTPGGIYTSFVITDALNGNFNDVKSNQISIKNEQKQDVTNYFNITVEYQSIVDKYIMRAEVKSEYLENADFYGHLYTITIPVSVKEGTGLKRSSIPNSAATNIRDSDISETKSSNEVTVSLRYKVLINSEIDHGKTNITIINNGTGYHDNSASITMNNIEHGDSSSYTVWFQVDDGYKITGCTIDGKQISVGELNLSASGIYTYTIKDENIRQDIEHNVIVTTELKDATLVVKHQDRLGNDLVEPETYQKKFFEPYSTSARNITGYKVQEIQGDATGTMTKEMITVTYVYQPYHATVTVIKKDKDTIITKEETDFALYEWSKGAGDWVKPTSIDVQNSVKGIASDGIGAILRNKNSGIKRNVSSIYVLYSRK